MEWWQILLASMVAILIAPLIGIFVAHLIIRFVYKERSPFFKYFYLLFSRNPRVFTPRDSVRQSTDKPSAPPKVHELAESPIPGLLAELPGLLAEFELNCKIVAEFSGDNLLPLQTDVWDAHRYSAYQVPTTLRVQLEQVYDDIHLLNNIAWLSIELGHRSSSLDGQYRKQLTSIYERLLKIWCRDIPGQ